MKIAFYTLGCRTNQFETQAMEKLFSARGFELVPWGRGADVYIVNSCTVTATADQKTRQVIRRVKRENPSAVLALCGCMAQNSETDICAALGIDVLGGNRDHIAFTEAVCAFLDGKETSDTGRSAPGFVELPAGGLAERTRALLKIEHGCDYYCTYCAIPYARGHVRSILPEKAEAEARGLADLGFGEIVVTGIEISAYGADIGYTEGLGGIAERITRAAYPARVSLGSLRPTVVTEDFCRRLSALPNFCRHFHLSIQSGSDGVLSRMKRRYGAAELKNAVNLLNKWFEEPNITGDVICGFCGETDAEFEETLNLVRELKLGGLHIFPYSRRAGTFAARMPDGVPKSVKDARCSALAEVSRENYAKYLSRQVGKKFTVVFEHQKSKDIIGGYTENYLYAETSGDSARDGDVKTVEITAATGEGLKCRVCE